ncbi:Fic family protein [Campylobacter upsaliensis]|nr:Fic family protein [Campylobacter upsaliensis]
MINMAKWIWQSPNYPHFFYDEKALEALTNELIKNENKINSFIANYKLDKLDLQIQNLSDEIINSADIEGELLKRESVRASLRKKLDDNFDEFNDTFATKQSDNYASILLDAHFNKTPLNIERLHGWHNALFESGYSGLYKINVASFRKDVIQVVSGKIGKEKVHYEAILPKDVEKNMQDFLTFCNHSSLNPYLKSAIAHLYFVIIHPYDDGNGRIARTIADFLLPSQTIKIYSLSSQINQHKKEYYELLEKTNRFNEKCDICAWLTWHLKMTDLAMKNTFKIVNKLIFKTQFWDKFKNYDLNHHQQKVLNKILDIGIDDFKGKLNANKYASIAKIDLATANKELDELCKIACLVKDEKGFNVRSDFFKNENLENKANILMGQMLNTQESISSMPRVKDFNKDFEKDLEESFNIIKLDDGDLKDKETSNSQNISNQSNHKLRKR